MTINFNFPYLVGSEIKHLKNVIDSGHLSGNGYYTKKCSSILENYLNTKRALLTHSCTAALEMAAILTDIKAGDEVIMPSYTFVSTANAFALRGATPVFIDIHEDTLNINETLIKSAITKKTKAIIPVHYAGVSCNMDFIMKLAHDESLIVIEDAAHSLGSEYNGKKVGTRGNFSAFSFHETKNIVSGEGGALIINDSKFIERAEIIREKGTNRTKFLKGEVDKYTWVDIGSSYLPSEIIAAFLYSQLENIDKINLKRLQIYNQYKNKLNKLKDNGYISLSKIPSNCSHNSHMLYILTKNHKEQVSLLNSFKQNGVMAIFHYIPLHLSKAGKKYGRIGSSMDVTENIYGRLIRLPLYPDLTENQVSFICSLIENFYLELK